MNTSTKRLLVPVASFLLGLTLSACVRQTTSPEAPMNPAEAQGSNPNGGTGGNSVGQQVPESSAPIRNADDLQQLSATYAQIAGRVTPAVVNINTRVVENASQDPFGGGFGDEEAPQVMRGTGSGVIVDGRGIILTNNHVVAGAQSIMVTLTDQRRFRAQLVGTDPATDVAVLKISAQQPLPTLQYANSDQIRVGDIVLAIGSPLGLSSSVTQGIISAKSRSDLGISTYEDFLQTDAAINPGNSGGALVDVTGRLVGINTAILSRSGGNQGIGLAIPSNLAQRVAAQLANHRQVTRGYLGLSTVTVTDDIARQLHLTETRGVLVTRVAPNGPTGSLPWVRNGGNVILSANGVRIDTEGQLRNLAAGATPGSHMTLQVRQPSGVRTFTVTVRQRPSDPPSVRPGGNEDNPPGGPDEGEDNGGEDNGGRPGKGG